ncbi:MAG: HAMP domain-containing histidine kinase [Rhodobacteraceae bacterium]|nr:HAMP domain-containing histidine kinase [Paracoccaceae bacterium]
MAGLVMALSLAGMAVQYRLVADRLLAGQRAALAADLDGLAALYDQRRIIALHEAIELRAATAATAASAAAQEMVLLRARDGQMLAAAGGAWPEAALALADGFAGAAAMAEPFTVNGQRWLGVEITLPGGFPLLVARSLSGTDRTLAGLRRLIAVIALGMLAVALPAGWWAARRVTARIARLNALADRVAAGDLGARLAGPPGPDEFGLLEEHVHAMLDRIEALNRATHRLSDTIAHELRTPLGRIAGRIDALEGDARARAALQAEIRGLIRLFDTLLDISRAEAATGSGGGLVPVDLSALATDMAELYAPLAEERGLALTTVITPAQSVLGDRVLIGQMLANLLDNAVKFCAPGDRIGLGVAASPGGGAVLEVSDTGPGLPPALRAGKFLRFARGGADGRGPETPGHGLGLALVEAIATRHGARLALPDTAAGLTLRILWPPMTGARVTTGGCGGGGNGGGPKDADNTDADQKDSGR